jgi:pimeloyl-ACP methyl ester carboxylesterase
MNDDAPAMNDEGGDYYYRSADGLELYCRTYRARRHAGLPVVCLPGLTRNSRDFAALARRLQAEHEVLSPDLRGRGLSQWDEDASHYQLRTYVEDMWALLESRHIDRVAVIGTSLGALMGMVMAAASPAKIAGVVLNDAGPELDPTGLRRIAGYAGKLPRISSWAEAAAQAKSIHSAAAPDLSDRDWLDFAQRTYRENAQGVPVPDMDPRIGDAFRSPPTAPADMWPLYAQIKSVPLLVIRGALSDLLSAATVERMAREKPDLQNVTVANRGHAPLLDEPECITAIDGFLARYAGLT